MDPFSTEAFDVNLLDRRVAHVPSGIWFSFYEYDTEDEWQRSDSVIYRDDPAWAGDRMQLAKAAKAAALWSGMKARKPARSRVSA
jgi:hypothetical protein